MGSGGERWLESAGSDCKWIAALVRGAEGVCVDSFGGWGRRKEAGSRDDGPVGGFAMYVYGQQQKRRQF